MKAKLSEKEEQRICTRIVAWHLDSDTPLLFTNQGVFCVFCHMQSSLLWKSPWLLVNHAENCLTHDIAKLKDALR